MFISDMETKVQHAVTSADAIANIKHILVPVDFSEAGVTAAVHARQLARLTGAGVTLLHVNRADEQIDRDGIRSYFNERDWSSNSRTGAEVAERLDAIFDGFEVRRLVVPGDAADRIGEYVQAAGVDMVIMPTRGLGPVRRFLLGSVTAKVLHDVDCPVWTVLQEPRVQHSEDEAEIRHIVCAIDLGPASAGIIRWSADLAKKFNASLTVVHVNAQLEPVVGVVHDAEYSAHVAGIVRREISDLISNIGVKATIRLAGGEPAKAVSSVAAELGADVLVIGRPVANRFMGRLRTHSYAIIRQSASVISV
jgi:nucleotide-binding universal stress UspA family protein